MKNSATFCMLGDPAVILDRHVSRGSAGIPTVSLLVGPIGLGKKTWRRWSADRRRSVVVATNDSFPYADWIYSLVERVDLPSAVVRHLAERAGRDAEEFLTAWRTKTPVDCERFWNTLAPREGDDLLQTVAGMASRRASASEVAEALIGLGERTVPAICRLICSTEWPNVLFAATSIESFYSLSRVVVKWAISLPALSLALAATAEVWAQYRACAPESRDKALMKEGEICVAALDAPTVERRLVEAGARESMAATLFAVGADEALLESAVAAVRATADPPANDEADDRARSAAERFLFEFLEALTETAGRFELNAQMDFNFGLRPAEVDLLCRSPKVAIEIDGYFHFLTPDAYRRDRNKDWELQRRGFLVLRFLAVDIIPRIEVIRDRILDALGVVPQGVHD